MEISYLELVATVADLGSQQPIADVNAKTEIGNEPMLIIELCLHDGSWITLQGLLDEVKELRHRKVEVTAQEDFFPPVGIRPFIGWKDLRRGLP